MPLDASKARTFACRETGTGNQNGGAWEAGLGEVYLHYPEATTFESYAPFLDCGTRKMAVLDDGNNRSPCNS